MSRRSNHSSYDYWDDRGWVSLPAGDVKGCISPLLNQLSCVDDLIWRLEKEGGARSDYNALTALLAQRVELQLPWERISVQLDQPVQLRHVLGRLYPHDVRFEVLRRRSGLPAFYLARVRSDYYEWRSSVVVEDYHISAGFPFASDQRFVLLTGHDGRERSLFRLSSLRAAAQSLVLQQDGEHAVDAILWKAAPLLQACSHSDQMLVRSLSTLLSLTHLGPAVELVYLCLGVSELSSIRAIVEEDPAVVELAAAAGSTRVADFLRIIAGLDGEQLAAIPARMQLVYGKLCDVTERLLETPGQCDLSMLDWCLGNYSRLDSDRVKTVLLEQNPGWKESGREADQAAADTVEEFLSSLRQGTKTRASTSTIVSR